ncbi:DUF4468 domain-containing protein [Pedobacter punctiformis]|uniref:DUF4468 domain-containing protein n=1 Tax=Pedobacter punctiformis TaxID=3004097 RepID=A0ABT4LCP5_9SPHI|nr:DUF4468 domain-containing protein [Pedobacter sp. HCMS5-2]MCZ4245691.1 DUF4468 domain-containing protein [Pedobacter sp. HCMS5-2]
MKYLSAAVLAFIFFNVSAQQKQFPLDERGKYIYYEVVNAKSLTKDSLMDRADVFINKLYAKNIKQESKTDTSIISKGKMIIDKTLLVASHPSGEVNYNFTVEVRDGKYRFWLTDFEFIPYQRDRYGNYVATTPMGTALEKTPGKLNAGVWKDIVASAYAKTVKFAEEFKKVLETGLKEKTKKKTEAVSTKNW